MKQDAMRATEMGDDGRIGQDDKGRADGFDSRGSDAGWPARDAAAHRFAERLSAAIDGEAPLSMDAPSAGTNVFASWTTAQKQEWSLYHLVGDALRSDDLAHSHRGGWDFTARFSARLAQEPAIVAPPRSDRVWDEVRADAASAAAAPTVGDAFRHHARSNGQRTGAGQLAGWFGGRGKMPAAAAAAAAVVTLAWTLGPAWHGGSPASPSAPTTLASAGNWQRVNLGGDRDLDPYLAAHQEFASDRGSLGYVSYAGAGH